jgi:pimeloyl-ACP methyl ester carboxylesterase
VISSLIFDGAPDLTSTPGLTANDVPLDRFRSLVRGGDSERFRSEWLSHPMSRLNSTDRTANATLQAMVARYPANDLQQTHPGDVDDPPLAIGIPTLILNGALDLQTRKDAGIALKQALLGSEHIFISGAGHLANLDNPEEYNATVRNFLERHPA